MPATPVSPPAYRRREPEKEPLYQILAGHLETFLQHTRTSEHQLPLHVEKEMRAYLDCGILAYGFVRARCEDCGGSRAVAFSCKKRGFCPSCCGRRMADTAARLVDEVLPRVPVRQSVLSFPYEMRYRLAYDGEWVSKVLAVFLRVVGGRYRRQAQAMGHSNALKTPWSDGTSHLLLSPMELLEKLAALVPPPRFHLLRYHGVLAPRARDRHRIVPTQPVAESPAADRASSAPPCAHRLGWAALLARVFATDLSACPACGGRLRIIAALTDPASIRRYLVGVGLPPKAPPRAPPQPQFAV